MYITLYKCGIHLFSIVWLAFIIAKQNSINVEFDIFSYIYVWFLICIIIQASEILLATLLNSLHIYFWKSTPLLHHIATFIGIVLYETKKRIWHLCFSLYFNFLFCTGVYQINKQCYDSFRRTVKGLSHTCTCIHSPQNSSRPGCHKTLSTVPCAILLDDTCTCKYRAWKRWSSLDLRCFKETDI